MSKIRRRQKKRKRSERRAAKSRFEPNFTLQQHEVFHQLFTELNERYKREDADFFTRMNSWCLFGVKKKMNISVVQEDGTENEFELEMCCPDCATRLYGWTTAQFNKISTLGKEPLKVPDNIITTEQFKQFVKSL